MQIKLDQLWKPVQRSRKYLNQMVVRQINTLQVGRHVCGNSPKPVPAEVEGLQIQQCVVDEDHFVQVIVRQIQILQVPVISCVFLFQRV